MRNIKQNLFFAFIYNALGIPLGGGRPLSLIRSALVTHDRCRGNEFQLGFGGGQRVASSQDLPLIRTRKNPKVEEQFAFTSSIRTIHRRSCINIRKGQQVDLMAGANGQIPGCLISSGLKKSHN